MSFTLYDWLIFIFVPLITWAIGMRNRNVGNWRGYFLAQGTLSTGSVAATYFGANLTFTAIFLVLSEESYRRGYWVLSVPICWILGTIFFWWLYKYIGPYIEQGMTLHQAIGNAFQSRSLQKLASVWTIIAFVGTVGLEFYGGVKLLQWLNIPLLNSLSLALLMAFIVASFTALGGFRSVAVADIILDIVTLAGAVIIVFYLFSFFSFDTIFSTPGQPIIEKLSSQENSIKPITGFGENLAFAIGMVFIFIPFQVCTLDSWQRLSAWKKRGSSLVSVLLIPSFFLALIYCIPIFLGIAMSNQGILIAPNSHPLKEFLILTHIPSPLIGIIVTGFIAAMFSTADELLNCASLSLLFDFFGIPKDNANRDAHQEKRLVLAGQIYTGVFAFLAAIIAFFALWEEKKISEWALAVFSTQVVFIFPLLIALLRKNFAPFYKKVAIVAMIISFFLSLAFISAGWIANDKTISDSAPIVAFSAAGIMIGIFALIRIFNKET